MTAEAVVSGPDTEARRGERGEGWRVNGVNDQSPLALVRMALPTLVGAKRRVAEVILADPQTASRSSITWLAAEAETSPATVTRLSASLGFDGFPEFRAAIASEHGRGVQAGWERDIGSAISPGDPAEKVLSTLAGNQFNAARNAMASVDLDAMGRVADQIVAARRVHIFGEWGDGPPAYELYLRLFRIGIPVWFDEGPYYSQVGASLLGEGDVALVLSRSGESPLAERFVAIARTNRALSVVVTGAPDSTLARRVDVPLYTGTGVGGSWTDYFAGRASDALVGGLLWALVAQRVPDLVYDRLHEEDHRETPQPLTGRG